MDNKIPTTVRLSPEAKRLLVELARYIGVSQTDILEMAVREFAAKRDVK